MTQSSGLLDQFHEASDPDLQGRVQMGSCKTAQAVASEPPTNPNHAARNNLAMQVSRSPIMYTQSFTAMLCAQGITRASTDADIEGMVSACWDTLAGSV